MAIKGWAIGRIGFFAAWILTAVFAPQSPGGSIFDDDFTPPPPSKPNQQPEQTTPQPPPVTPQPAPDLPPKPKPQAAPPPAPAGASQRIPVPSKSEQLKSKKLFNDLFAKELKDVTPQGRRALAQKLVDEASRAGNAPTDQFVLLGGAVQSAKLGSDLTLCSAAADAMSAVFAVDALGLKVNSALTMPLKTSPPEITHENCRRGLELVTELTALHDYSTASKLLAAIRSASATDSSLRDEVQRYAKALESAKKMSEELGPALAKLKVAPNDPIANLSVGENLCFVQDNWSQGLPYLAKGSDPELKSLAARDLAEPTAPDDVAALGNAWWDASAKREGTIKNGMRVRGYMRLSAAISQLKGLSKIAAEKRLAESPFLGTHVGLVSEINSRHGSVKQVAFAPDGHSALLVGTDKTISLWNLLTSEEVRQFAGHAGDRIVLGVAPTGQVFISSGGNDQTTRLWDIDSGKELHKVQFHSYAQAVCMSPDGTKALCTSNNDGPFLVSVSAFATIPVASGGAAYAVGWSESGKLFATGGWNKVVHVFDAKTLKEVAALAQPDQVYTIAFTPDDKALVTGDPANHIRVFDIQSRKVLHEFDVAASGQIAITPDSRFVAIADGSPNLIFRDLVTCKPSDWIVGQQASLSAVAISKDGKLALSGDKEGSIRLWRLPATQ